MQTGNLRFLENAIEMLRRAFSDVPVDDPYQPWILSNLGSALQRRGERTGRVADVDEAIAWFEKAIRTSPADYEGQPAFRANLGNALRTRYEQTGQPADLDAAIAVGREAVATTPAGHPGRPMFLSNLRNVVHLRYERAGQSSDLDEGISLGREVLAATPADDPDRPGYLANLGTGLYQRYLLTGRSADLEENIALAAEAVAATPDGHLNRPMYLAGLSNALFDRYQQGGPPADLAEAIARNAQALAATPIDHPHRSTYLTNQSHRLLVRFERSDRAADLEEAIRLGRDAVAAAPVADPRRSDHLSGLGAALRLRYDRTGAAADLVEAATAFRDGAAVLTAVPAQRMFAAQSWGRAAMAGGDPSTAVQAYAAAIELLPATVWHGLDQTTREHHLRNLGGLSAESATAAIAAGAPARAVEMLEASRSVLWAQALQMRQDVTTLQDRAPELAAVLQRSRSILADPTPAEAGAGVQQSLERRRVAARDWDAAIAQIRRVQGFHQFLRPASFVDLQAATTAGPVVIVNTSTFGSHALIVVGPSGSRSDAEVRVVELPDAPMDVVLENAEMLLTAQGRAAGPGTGRRDRQAVFDVLAWMWHAITEPVLRALGYLHPPPGPLETWPRLWWCPTGPAVVLPLHAAGRYPRTSGPDVAAGERVTAVDTVPARVVSSYTPTLSALVRARNRSAPSRVHQLAVGLAEKPAYEPDASALPGVSGELRAVSDFLPEPEHATHLRGAAATRQAVLRELPAHSWLHLSCHASQEDTDPNRSAFLLHDRRLTLADLTALNLPEADLAYLAACHTATGSLELIDESLHLAAGLQLVGYRHVLATLWSISDRQAPAVATAVYRRLTQGGPDAERAPYALHSAVAGLRAAAPGNPLLWAPYVHLGP
jgi:tetratricopeptide (TPR) repeat protein